MESKPEVQVRQLTAPEREHSQLTDDDIAVAVVVSGLTENETDKLEEVNNERVPLDKTKPRDASNGWIDVTIEMELPADFSDNPPDDF
jgi:hypothetical protein